MKKLLPLALLLSLFTNISLFANNKNPSSDTILIFKPYKNIIKKEHIKTTEVIKEEKKSNVKDDEIIGTIRFLDLFNCKNMIYKRGIFVWLPERYTKDSGPYSVIYFHDAQNLFLPSKSFSGYDWKVDETITRLRKDKLIKPCIVVGIPNSPARDKELNYETTDGKAYSDFIIKEVMPFIKKQYPVSKHREDHIISFALYKVANRYSYYYNPRKFGGAICMSSAFHRKISNILKEVNETKTPPINVKFYIDSGELETEKQDNEDILSLYKEMVQALKSKGFRENINLKSYLQKRGHHNEKSWAERLDKALLFVIGK